MSAADAPVLFELRAATLGYGRRVVLRQANLTIRSGEFWCVIGPNAAGKTTLIRTLLGEIEPLSGMALVDREQAAPSRIGFVPQQCLLNPTLPTTVREFVGLGFVGLSLARLERAERMRWALDRVNLAGRDRENYFRLSGGQRQRALLARALVRRPSVLVLDEPTQELDTVAEQQLLATVGDLNVREGVTVVFVTHELDIPARYATHVTFVKNGTLETGPKAGMLTPAALAETFGADRSFFEDLAQGELAMIDSFLEAWPLFQNAFLAGWGIALVLGLLGIVVVARDQIFVGVAMSQASMLGIATSMWAGALLAGTAWAAIGSEESSAFWAIGFSILTAFASARAEARGGETHEAITGWVFLTAGSVSILILAHSPHGVEEIHRLVASSLIGARERDVAIFGVLGALTVFAAAFLRRPVMLYAMDQPMAASVGLPVRLMSAIFSAALGVAVGLSIRVSGMLYTFGCLVLPALAAKSLCREVSGMFWVAPLVGVSSAVVAFVLANEWDYPPAQMTVAVLSGVVVAAWIVRRFRNAIARAPAITPPAA